MKMSKLNLGKTVYIVDSRKLKMYEGRIVKVEEKQISTCCKPRGIATVETVIYTAETNAEDPHYKTISLCSDNYKNRRKCIATSFYYIKEQAIEYLEACTKLAVKHSYRNENTKETNIYLSLSDIAEKSNNQLIEDLTGRPNGDLIINQSHRKKMLQDFEKLREIFKNKDSIYFNMHYAPYDFPEKSGVIAKVNVDKIIINFNSKVFDNKLVDFSIRVQYDDGDCFYAHINLNKWSIFFSYSPQ